jgi:hypothetical protein
MMKVGIRITVFCLFGVFMLHVSGFAQDAPDTASPGKVTLRVITTPAHARIYINNSFSGISPLTATVDVPGDYVVEARLSRQTTSAQISLTGETLTEVNLTFPPQPFNILALIILLVLTGAGIIVLRRVKSREVIYSTAKNRHIRK